MGEHYPRATVSVSAWCKRCQKPTHHRIDDRRKGPCLECIAKLEREHVAAAPKSETQQDLFGGAA